MKKISLYILLISCSVLMMQCKKNQTHASQDVDPALASFENMRVHILQHNCVSCHNTATNTGLILEGADLYTSLINATPKNIDAKNAGLKLVMPNNADSSFFYTKCAWNTTPFKYGAPMPNATLLSADEILFIKQWINAGAPKTGVVADYKLLHAH
jgi:hypothetical protein